ncbi:nuclear transport factor 2 family protein [Caulobacter segnis]|uniref:nuclear transport factor 2 family protein n=1 Tax=Caulobacter segnis TaxID=88688 RepID=UPI001CBB94B4|nr:nuclear transport factor 2 family protein [Caulobacter segnis]UAL08783.1 nuclear transport factor 2 family protein [Caulobacter segnis]
MTPDEDRIAQLYDAYNGRAFDRCVAMLTDDVEWPNEVESGVIEGREAVRTYLTEVTAPLRAHYDLISLHTDARGRVSVLSRQAIASAVDGSLWSSTRVAHRFTLKDGQIARLEAEQDVQATTFPGIADLLTRLHGAINARDLDAIVACYAPTARFADTFESGEVLGLDGVRAHFEHLLDTVRLKLVVLDHALEPDDRVRARIQVETRGPAGGLWQDDTITVWYRLERGLIVEQDIDDSGRDPDAP